MSRSTAIEQRTFLAQVTESTQGKRTWVSNRHELPGWIQHLVKQVLEAEPDVQRKAMLAVAEVLSDGLVERVKKMELLGWEPAGVKRDLMEIAKGQLLPPAEVSP